MKEKTTCLVPFYNEGKRILRAVRFTTEIANLHEIILIDDGSDDQAAFAVKKNFPSVKILRLKDNSGKTEAIRRGMREAKGENILLFDGDYDKVNTAEIEKAISFFRENKKWDMILLRNLSDAALFKFIRTDIVITGLRLIRKKHLEKVLRLPFSRFELELGINDWMLKHHRRVGWLPAHYRGCYKAKKFGFAKGWLKEMKMGKQLLTYKNPLWYLGHLATFCRQKAE